jgi:hypothetical protein
MLYFISNKEPLLINMYKDLLTIPEHYNNNIIELSCKYEYNLIKKIERFINIKKIIIHFNNNFKFETTNMKLNPFELEAKNTYANGIYLKGTWTVKEYENYINNKSLDDNKSVDDKLVDKNDNKLVDDNKSVDDKLVDKNDNKLIDDNKLVNHKLVNHNLVDNNELINNNQDNELYDLYYIKTDGMMCTLSDVLVTFMSIFVTIISYGFYIYYTN